MKYRRFEDLPVWQDSAELARKMYEFTAAEPLRRHRGLRDQLECAALSVSNNIAEGFERGTLPKSCLRFSISPVAQQERYDLCFMCSTDGVFSAISYLKLQI